VLEDADGKQAVDLMVKQWAGLDKLESRYQQYRERYAAEQVVDQKNKAQRHLREAFGPFFATLHEGLRQLDKIMRRHEKQQAEEAQTEGRRVAIDRETKALKTALEELHTEVKNAEIFYRHIGWLQERFPRAEYEDVTGMCKLASRHEIREQQYSLNPGRYVGVVIEEDGKTKEEFLEEILSLHREISLLGKTASQLQRVIDTNVRLISGES
jgi:type I restriction enzyme M protein